MKQMRYENFVRNAFEVALGKSIGRGGDLACLAEADYFNMSGDKEFLNKIKTGTSYAIAINNNILTETKMSKLEDPCDFEKMNNFLDRALEVKDSNEVIEVIEQYIQFKDEVNSR
ncbi:hypothetical protein [Clostridium botulinum]